MEIFKGQNIIYLYFIEKGKTEIIKGFKNKEGKTFNASLKFENNKTTFDKFK